MHTDDMFHGLSVLAGLFLLLSPFLGFFAYWVFLLMKLGWGFAELMANRVSVLF